MWLLIPILVYSVIYLYIRHVYSYWQRKGFPHEKASLTWTFLRQVYEREFRHVHAVEVAYRASRERFVGIYCFFRPSLLVRDPQIARLILQNANGHFNNTKWDYVHDYSRHNLLEQLAPIFSPHHLEAMFDNIEKVADQMMTHLKALTMTTTTTITRKSQLSADAVDMQQLLRVYALNMITNLIYGLDDDLFEQTDTIFVQYLNRSFTNTTFSSYTLSHFTKKSSLSYRLRDIIKAGIEKREQDGLVRKDILQLLIKYRNNNDITNKTSKANWHIENSLGREKALSMKKMAQVAEHFLENGLSSISATSLFTLYELLQQQDLLRKIGEEIREAELETGKSLTFEGLQKLKFLDLCIQETVRKYPSVPLIERVCRKNYNIPESRFTLMEGRTLLIPLMALQHDERYFQDPLKYKPQRFVTDTNGNRGEEFIGLGLEVPACVAQDFAKVVIKVILVKLLLHYQLELPAQSRGLEVVYNGAPFIRSKQGLRLKLKPL